jgi:hypothetical protein
MMRQLVGIILIFYWLLFARAPLCAQNTPLDPFQQYNFLFNSDNLLPRPEINLPEPMQTEIKQLGNIIENCRLLFTPDHKPRYRLIEHDDLLEKYLQELKIEPAVTMKIEVKKLSSFTVDRKVFNALYNKPWVDEKKLIRDAWRKVFGIDVWYPYYKAKEIEDWVKERMCIKVFKLKGNPEFRKDQILYVFKAKF